jgi:hypothetical protein
MSVAEGQQSKACIPLSWKGSLWNDGDITRPGLFARACARIYTWKGSSGITSSFHNEIPGSDACVHVIHVYQSSTQEICAYVH